MTDFNRFEDLADHLRKIPDRAHDLRVPLKEIAVVAAEDVQRFFTKESSAPAGVKWAPLAASTAKAFVTGKPAKIGKSGKKGKRTGRRRGFDHILQETGAMRRSVVGWVDSANSVALASNVPYANVHQHGGDDTPARPFLVYQKTTIERAVARVVKWCLEGV